MTILDKAKVKTKARAKGLSDKKRAFVEAVVARTWHPKKKEVDERSPQFKSIQKALDEGDWGCQQRHVYGLISAVIGATFVPTCAKPAAQGCCIVLRNNPNGHNYPLYVPIYVKTDSGRGVNMDGTEGNYLPIDDKKAYRLAAEEEIREFFRKLPLRGWERTEM